MKKIFLCIITAFVMLPSIYLKAQEHISTTQTNEWARNNLPSCHDPVAIKEGAYFYVFHTGNGVSVMRSTNMKHWEPIKPVFNQAPAWAVKAVPGYKGHTWAPDIIRHNGLYYLYYSVSTFGKNTSAIGVVTNRTLDPDSPDFGWTDHGMVIQSTSESLWNAIDPNIIIDEKGTPWMTFGSWWDGIQLVKLREDMLRVAEDKEWYTISSRSRNQEGQYIGNIGATEAPFLFHKNGYYYQFVSFDFCCRGADSDYKVVVGRSKDIRGPYMDKNGKNMLQGSGEIVVKGNTRFPGVGHCSVYEFSGKDYIFFHGYDMEDNGNSKLLIREINWDNGWPSVTL